MLKIAALMELARYYSGRKRMAGDVYYYTVLCGG